MKFPCLDRLLAAAILGTVSLDAAENLARSPFASASAREGSTLFHRLDPATTGLGVDNAYDDPQMWASRYRAFMGGGMGSGVAAGDFDGDGKVDLYVSTKTKPGRLFKNLGGWKFADVTASAGLEESASVLGWLKSAVSSDQPAVWRQGAVFADVDNDGRLDLYVCRNDAPNLLYMNRGNGTFVEEGAQRGLAVVDGSVVGAFADFDRDGWLDVFILTNQVDGTEPMGRPDRLFRNLGNGRFTEVTAQSGISGPTFGHAAVWFDYDGDRWPDIYVANDFSGADRLFRNNRDGTFSDVVNAVAPHTPYSSMGADTGDINNDGHIDLLVADMATTTREKDRRGLAASRSDAMMSGHAEELAPQYMRNALLLNTGGGLFQEAAVWAGIDATDWTWSVRFEDFDNDGWTDLHVTNGMVREANNSDLLSQMMRALSDLQRISAMKKSPPLEEANLAYKNLQGQGFTPVTADWGLDEVTVSFGAATADLDNDGDLDLVYLNYNGGLSVFRNDVAGQHRAQVRLRGTRSNRFGVGALVTVESSSGHQAQVLTVARGYTSGSEMVAHFGLGADTQIKRLTIEWPSGTTQIFRDLEADYAYLVTEEDAAATAPSPTPPVLFSTKSNHPALQFADASAPAMPDKEQAFIPFRTDRRGPGIAIADIDGDQSDDVYVAATPGSPAAILRWTGKTYARENPRGVPAAAVEDGPPLLLDVNLDGAQDLLITKASANATAWPGAFRPLIYANDGRGNFTATDWLPDVSINAGAVCAADIDGDGDLDLFIGARSVPGRYPEMPASVLLRNDGGRFADGTGTSGGLGSVGLVKSALFSDVDGDGRPDLVIALEWDYVRYFHNEGGGRFADWTEKAGFTSGERGWWNSLASADFNGDGRPDFAAGNLGLNTTYDASPEHPALLFYGDFAQNGTRLIAEAVHDAGRLHPLRPRSDLGARLPSVLRRYPKTNDFARATMTEVFGEKPLADAQVFRAGNFASGVFLSQPDGTHRFAAFPRTAQIAPIQGLVAADLDGDGLADVGAVQNTDAAAPRFAGGVGIFLKGHADGSFTAFEPADSGLLVPGNARALAILSPPDRARPDLFFTRHGGLSGQLINQSEVRWLRLRLSGGRGNPAAVGARVQVVYSNRPPSFHEVTRGGGWWSQPAPDLFIAVPKNGSVREAIVNWPDGHVSRHQAPADTDSWTLRR